MATLTVTTLADGGADNFDGGDLAAEMADGGGLSLREALALAQDNDTISFNEGGTITLASGELFITQDGLVIDGDLDNDGDADITIDANDASNVMQLAAGDSLDHRSLTLDGLVITEGSATFAGAGLYLGYFTDTTLVNVDVTSNTTSGGFGNGGGVYLFYGATLEMTGGSISGNSATRGGGLHMYTASTATMTGVTISDNDASNSGGGVYNNYGSLFLYDSVVSGNESPLSGGGILSRGSAHIADSEISGNGAYYGGGVLNANYSSMTIIRSEITSNTAEDGGGVSSRGASGTLTIASSYIGGNTAARDGGGLHQQGGAATIINTTFAGNSAAHYGGGALTAGSAGFQQSTITGNHAAGGGGFFNFGATTLVNSIVAGNDDNLGFGDDAAGGFGLSGGNIIGTNIYSGFADVGDTTLADTFASLGNHAHTGIYSGVAGDNGGDVSTVRIKNGGSAHSGGNAAYLPADSLDLDGDANTAEVLPVDARGLARINGADLDLGAMELEPATLIVTTTDDELFDGGDLAAEMADGGGLSLREALALAQDGDTVTFDNAIVEQTITLTNGQLNITQDGLTIDGDLDDDQDADMYISGGNVSRVMSVAAGSEGDLRQLTIDGLYIINGYTNESGGAGLYLDNETDVIIINSGFYGNYAAGATSGGAIIAGSQSALYITGGYFEDNGAGSGGGAIFAGNGVDLTIKGAHFEDNSVEGLGEGSLGGGAVNHLGGEGSTLTIIASTINDNFADEASGGGVLSNAEQNYIANSTFSHNYAVGSGGGLLLRNNATAAIVNTTFYGNEAGDAGGGVSIDASGAAYIYNSTFTGNAASDVGGGIHNAGYVALTNSIVAGNAAESRDDISNPGGAESASFQGVNIFSEAGSGDAQDIIVSDVSTVFAEVYSYAGFSHGVLGNNGGPVQTVAISHDGVAFNAGSVEGLPADFLDLDSDLDTGELLPVDARGHDRVSGGSVDIGALELQQYTVTTLADGGDDNYSGGDLAAETADGGGLSLREALELAQDGSAINFAEGLAGGSVMLGGVLTVSQNGIIIDGDIDNDGAADITLDGQGVSRVMIVNNEAFEGGAGTTLDGLVIANGGVVNSFGGGVYLYSDAALTLRDTVITGNTATGVSGFGGGISVGSGGYLRMYGGAITDNTAISSGGGIFVSDGAAAALHGVSVTGNDGNYAGGGIYGSEFSLIAAEDSYFANNEAYAGGAISQNGGYGGVYIIDTEFVANNAGGYGGALALDSTVASIYNSTFAGNTAVAGGNGGGGAIALHDASLYVSNSTFYGNQSDYGGAIAGDGAEIVSRNSTFTGNTATGVGGAVAIGLGGDFDHLHSANSIFVGNSAGEGQAFYMGGSASFFTDGGNVVQTGGYAGGGDVYTTSVAAVFKDSVTNSYSGVTSGKLEDNGGPVRTVMINGAGVAINAGLVGNLPQDLPDLDDDGDQGESIPFDARGFNRVANGAPDAGAVEFLALATAGDDFLIGTGDPEAINALAGNDTILGLAGADTITGGEGSDTASYEDSNAAIVVRLWNGTGEGGHAENDSLITVENVVGSDFGDAIVGADSVANKLDGGAGNDTLFALSGNDTLIGGAGADVLNGGTGVDTADYSSSAVGAVVRLWNGTGEGGDAEGDGLADIECVIGSEFDDAIVGADSVANLLVGGDGDDALYGLSGNDTIRGGGGADNMNGGDGVDTVDYSGASHGVTLRLWNPTDQDGDAAGDTVTAFEHVIGSSFNDAIVGADAVANKIIGGAGNDTLYGLSGNDTIEGGDGADVINGGDGVDYISYGGSSAGVKIRLWNGTGEAGDAQGDTFAGVEGVVGSSHNDAISGADGVDNVLYGSLGNDTLFGKSGNDTFVFAKNYDQDVIGDFAGNGSAAGDVIRLLSFGTSFDTLTEVMAAATQVGANTVINFGDGDTLTLTGVAKTSLHANDFLFG